MNNIKYLNLFKRGISTMALTFLSISAMAQAAEPAASTTATPPTDYTTFIWWLVIAAMVILLLAIAVLGNVLVTMAKISAPKVKNITAILLVLMTLSVTAEEAATAAPAAAKTSSLLDNLGIYLAITILLLEFFVLVMLARKIYSFAKGFFAAEEEKAKAAKLKMPSFLDRFNSSVSVDKEQDIILDHEYDGIRELDNDLPPWWKYGFYISIVWAVVYFGYYELGGGPTSLDEYNTAMEKADAEVAAYKAKHVVDVDENNILLADAAGIKAGKTIFESNCAVCHGKEAEGIVGPNLTDDYWLHGGSLNDIFKTIKYGVLEKGMTSWKDILSPTDIVDVTSYVKSLHGTKPANAKAPDGELYKEEEASAVAADSTTAAAK